ncbi:C-X-C motif chemokine 19 [Xiphias gladius]|uniref:C-X-C motif chemokine 19 n=1 Tax=Xiphias gladius TaxID=8245 RepID=UPI001A9901DE|nr:C-X-C motif chemokine 19 [Xiphias gladius]
MKLCFLVMFLPPVALVNGMPPINKHYNTHCRCLQVESRIIPPDKLRSIKLVPESPHCPDTEVIAGLASGEKVCLNPRSSWVKKLIHLVLERQLHQQGRALPKNQS